MICKICEAETSLLFRAEVLYKYEVAYYRCLSCGFIQTEQPYWLPEAYGEALNASDTGAVIRSQLMARVTAHLISSSHLDAKGTYVDFAGGYGLFTRIMRDLGFHFFWQDEYAKNLMARGFDYDAQKHPRVEMITAFEVFEHLLDPIGEIGKLLSISDTILFSTNLVPEPTPGKLEDWDYFSPQHGQHIAFWSRGALESIAKKYGLYFYTNGATLHLLSRQKFSSLLTPLILKLKPGYVTGSLTDLWYRRRALTFSDNKRLIEESRPGLGHKADKII